MTADHGNAVPSHPAGAAAARERKRARASSAQRGIAAGLACVFATAWLAGPALAADTVTLKGSMVGVTDFEESVFPGGNRLYHGATRAIATLDGGEVLTSDCLFLGIIAGGESFTADFYCGWRSGRGDGFVTKGVDQPHGGVVEIISGAGRWAGATGEGSYAYTFVAPDRAALTFEFVMRVP